MWHLFEFLQRGCCVVRLPAMSPRLKVLISAYACEPGKGSEPGVGWNVALGMARFHDVWVLTRSNNRPVIESALEKEKIPNLRFLYHDLPAWARFWKRGQRGVQLYYHLWQLSGIRVVRRYHAEIGFDLVHHVTFVKYWVPACVAFLDTAFVWGPVGGGVSVPFRFLPLLGFSGVSGELIRIIARWFGELDPLVRRTAHRSTIALATTTETANRLRRLGAKRVELLMEVGLSREEKQFLGECKKPHSLPFRFVYLGRLIPLKGQHLALRAFALANLPEAEYWFIGDGPQQAALKDLARSLRIESKVRFFGHLPRMEALKKLRECHVLVHPSLRESGGWACPEAMAAFKPVICLSHGGPGIQVENGCGFAVKPITPRQAIQDLAQAMERLYRDPDLYNRVSEAARAHATSRFDWGIQAERLNEIYLVAHEIFSRARTNSRLLPEASRQSS